MTWRRARFLALLVIAGTIGILAAQSAVAASRIKDIAQLQAARDNQLIGYGLVVGLQGTGDSLRLIEGHIDMRAREERLLTRWIAGVD